MPEISRFYGIVIRMYFREHNPPHFHAEYQDYEAIVNIQTGEVTGKMSRRALKMIYEWLDSHKDELMENWQRGIENKQFHKIEPLD
jgi:hypothetical protein